MDRSVAGKYLKGFGRGAESSKMVLFEVLKGLNMEMPSIIELGCGNAQLYEFLHHKGLRCSYTGVDFSDSLLEAARQACGHLPRTVFLRDDVEELTSVSAHYDVAIYSHVIEMLASPEKSLAHARRLAEKVAIRFFEPPNFDLDTVELRYMPVGLEKEVPYLRRKMSRDYYRLILTGIGCTRVEVFDDLASKDEVHLLHFD
jgi:ubiquinone/menaquinone biosynthesis C-methylase UbiE